MTALSEDRVVAPPQVEYAWKQGARPPVRADVVGQHIESLAAKLGRDPTAFDLLQSARPAGSPVHLAFEWDDTVAAEAYRLAQAGHLIRHLVVRVRVQPQAEQAEMRAFVALPPAPGDDAEKDGPTPRRVYVPIQRAMRDPEQREQVMQQALRDLRVWQQKYRQLERLAKVMDLLDVQLSLLEGEQA